MRRLWEAWVAVWDRKESPAALALVRIFVGACLFWDLVDLARIGVVGPMLSAAPTGYAMPETDFARTLVEHGLGPTVWVIATVAAACIALGLATRASCVALVIASVQLAHICPDSDRGIQMILRVVVGILALSQSHARWSVDALVWKKLGRPFPDQVPAWPRYLLLLQLLWIYFSAGISKGGSEWGPSGGFLALANALAEPSFARFDPGWLATVLPLTRIATAVTLTFEVSAPLYLLWLYYAETADRPGRLRRWSNKLRVRWIWIAIGVGFHLGLVIAMPLGIFPWGMLAIYPVLLSPRELSYLQ